MHNFVLQRIFILFKLLYIHVDVVMFQDNIVFVCFFNYTSIFGLFFLLTAILIFDEYVNM